MQIKAHIIIAKAHIKAHKQTYIAAAIGTAATAAAITAAAIIAKNKDNEISELTSETEIMAGYIVDLNAQLDKYYWVQ